MRGGCGEQAPQNTPRLPSTMPESAEGSHPALHQLAVAEEPQPVAQPAQEELSASVDPFEALGMGPDLYEYREPYRQFLPLGPPPSQLELDELYRQAAAAIAGADYLVVGVAVGETVIAYSADVPSPSLLKHILQEEGGTAE